MSPTCVADDISAFSKSNLVESIAMDTGEGLTEWWQKNSEWFRECEKNIYKLQELEPSWNSYGAKPVSVKSIQLSRDIIFELSKMSGVNCPRIGASPTGNVVLTWEWHDFTRELEIEIDPAVGIRYSYTDECSPEKECEGETVNPMDIRLILTK
ncbi:hypothetical protein [Gimesia maris]|uniref:Ig-like domain-containing protein n=1 Tax=Gimesia maris TaxID=122 RepID=A0ABX5YH23_9PLAN|nr:hypothetical protein [Gimesia maris]EDL61755.1 hypothetical protein PM8797T_05620 [Gimesia maris DSM 8797]QEG14857.1 hypothetical protein GmarT_06940 [Gimesia maris]QGQ31755.1 hypothetical protein F1729_25725 [Gimesia maris]